MITRQLKSTRFMVFTLLLSLAAVASADHGPFKICVPQSAYNACQIMVEQGKTVGIEWSCVAARDRIDCMDKIKSHIADFEAVDPEEMLVAIKRGQQDDFQVVKEIRTKEEPQMEFRYEAVVVVPKELKIDSIGDLKGLRSCHTGIGRNVGYKIPITKLTKMGVLGPLSDSTLSPRENELKALSQFFSKSCIVGTWSPNPETNKRLKATYSNLCALCENPDKCDYPDANSGYEGALRCLTKGEGQVAFTKVIFVKKYFGMAYGTQPAQPNENDAGAYSYLCPDATTKPLTGPPCTWAARPWPGYMATQEISKEYKELREQITKLNDLGESKHADWITSVLALNNKTLAVDNTPETPVKYLEKAKYLDVLERDVLKPRREVRLCVANEFELDKCETMALATYARDVRPAISCVKRTSIRECMKAVNEKEAEIMVVDPQEAIRAEKDFNMKPIINEQYEKENKQELVAIVNKGSSVNTYASLHGKRACLTSSDKSGFAGVMKYLLNMKYIQKNVCPYETSVGEFFNGVEQSDDPIECLLSGKRGDVAFVPYSSIHPTVKDQIEVLCPSKEKHTLERAQACGIFTLPPRMVMASKNLSPVQIEEVTHTTLAAAQLFVAHPEYFLMFGPYKGKSNVLFSDHATGLVTIDEHLTIFNEYKKMTKDLANCSS